MLRSRLLTLRDSLASCVDEAARYGSERIDGLQATFPIALPIALGGVGLRPLEWTCGSVSGGLHAKRCDP